MKMVSVTEILSKVTDTADYYHVGRGPHEWFRLISNKMADPQTPAIIRAIETQGFTAPICIEVRGENNWHLGNGHHRMAIAILTGMDAVPVDFSSWYSAASEADAESVEDDYREDDWETAIWISNTAATPEDLKAPDFVS